MQGAPASPSTGQHRRRSWIPRYPHRTPAGGRRLLSASGTTDSAPHSVITDGRQRGREWRVKRNAVAVRTGARAGAEEREYVVGRVTATATAAATTTGLPGSDARAVRLAVPWPMKEKRLGTRGGGTRGSTGRTSTSRA